MDMHYCYLVLLEWRFVIEYLGVATLEIRNSNDRDEYLFGQGRWN